MASTQQPLPPPPPAQPLDRPATPGPFSLSPGRAALCLAVMALSVIAAVALSFLLPDNRYVRHQQARDSLMFHAGWIYERINFDPTPIDVAIVGSSRLESAISPALLSQRLSQKLARPVSVANLSLVKPGRDYNWITIQNLIARHPEVKLIVVADDGNTNLSHDLFKNVADADAVLGAPLLINSRYFENLLFLPYRNISYAAQAQFPRLFGVRTRFDPAAYLGSGLDRTLGYRTPEGDDVNGDHVASPEEMRKSLDVLERAQRRSATGRLMALFPVAMRQAGERYYMHRIDRLSRNHGVRIAFVHVPYFRESDYRPNPYYRQFGQQFFVPGVKDDARLFWNSAHLNRAGAIVATARVADDLTRMLAGPAKADHPAE